MSRIAIHAFRAPIQMYKFCRFSSNQQTRFAPGSLGKIEECSFDLLQAILSFIPVDSGLVTYLRNNPIPESEYYIHKEMRGGLVLAIQSYIEVIHFNL